MEDRYYWNRILIATPKKGISEANNFKRKVVKFNSLQKYYTVEFINSVNREI